MAATAPLCTSCALKSRRLWRLIGASQMHHFILARDLGNCLPQGGRGGAGLTFGPHPHNNHTIFKDQPDRPYVHARFPQTIALCATIAHTGDPVHPLCATKERSYAVIILSLSSIPPRFAGLPRFFAHLARQSLQPDVVELNLPATYRRFPGPVPTLPALPDWVRICFTSDDLGPATKILPTVARHATAQARLVYCDDDRIYDRNWLARLVASHKTHPKSAICESGWNISGAVPPPDPALPLTKTQSRSAKLCRATSFGLLQRHRRQFRRAGQVHIAEGFGGVLLRADWLDDPAFHILGIYLQIILVGEI